MIRDMPRLGILECDTDGNCYDTDSGDYTPAYFGGSPQPSPTATGTSIPPIWWAGILLFGLFAMSGGSSGNKYDEDDKPKKISRPRRRRTRR